MKTIACKDLGVECSFVAKGDTAPGVIKDITSHAKLAHQEAWTKMQNMSEIEREKMLMSKMKESM